MRVVEKQTAQPSIHCQVSFSWRDAILIDSNACTRQQNAEQEVIKLSLANLQTFPWIAERVADGTLTLRGAWFAIRAGTLLLLQPNGSFQAV
jgi:carbonic anhydrase